MSTSRPKEAGRGRQTAIKGHRPKKTTKRPSGRTTRPKRIKRPAKKTKKGTGMKGKRIRGG